MFAISNDGYDTVMPEPDEGVDIVASKDGRDYPLQVKTSKGKGGLYTFRFKKTSHERLLKPNAHYVFVLRKPDENVFVVVPYADIQRQINLDNIPLKNGVYHAKMRLNTVSLGARKPTCPHTSTAGRGPNRGAGTWFTGGRPLGGLGLAGAWSLPRSRSASAQAAGNACAGAGGALDGPGTCPHGPGPPLPRPGLAVRPLARAERCTCSSSRTVSSSRPQWDFCRKGAPLRSIHTPQARTGPCMCSWIPCPPALRHMVAAGAATGGPLVFSAAPASL